MCECDVTLFSTSSSALRFFFAKMDETAVSVVGTGTTAEAGTTGEVGEEDADDDDDDDDENAWRGADEPSVGATADCPVDDLGALMASEICFLYVPLGFELWDVDE